MRLQHVAVTLLLCGACVEDLPVLGPAPGADVDGGVGDGGSPDAGPPDAGGPVDQVGGRTLSAGDGHTCTLSGGTLWCWGNNASGQLGLGDRDVRLVPEVVGGATDWTQIVAGAGHTCGARADGSIWCWGDNSAGQLGLGDTDLRTRPTEVAFPGGVYLLETSQSHTCALPADSSLWCWGENGEGEIGLDDWPPVFVLEPTRVPDETAWIDVSTGQGHTVAILDGALYGWGRNSTHQLGLGTGAPEQRRVPTFVHDSPFREVSGGQNHSCGISESGDLWCWGDNSHAQLGTGDRADRDRPTVVDASGDWLTVDVDTFHTCGLRAPGTLWCWGRGIEGQLGTGGIDDMLVPTKVGDRNDWTEVAVGRFHTCAKRADDTVWCMGANYDASLGLGDYDRRYEPTLVDVIR